MLDKAILFYINYIITSIKDKLTSRVNREIVMPEAVNLQSRRVKKTEERPFWQELEEMLQSSVFNDDEQDGYLRGSMSGESWKAFLKMVRDEVLERLDAYQADGQSAGFCASTLGPYREEKKKIERAYLRNLMVLYRSAERTYKSLSG